MWPAEAGDIIDSETFPIKAGRRPALVAPFPGSIVLRDIRYKRWAKANKVVACVRRKFKVKMWRKAFKKGMFDLTAPPPPPKKKKQKEEVRFDVVA